MDVGVLGYSKYRYKNHLLHFAKDDFLCLTIITVANCKKVSNFVLSWEFFYDRHIFDESVLAFVLEWKSGKFQKHKDSNTLVTSYCSIGSNSCSTQYGCGVLFICA